MFEQILLPFPVGVSMNSSEKYHQF